MGRIVVTEFVSLDGVDRGPRRVRGLRVRRLELQFDRGAEGNEFKIDETRAWRGAAARAA